VLSGEVYISCERCYWAMECESFNGSLSSYSSLSDFFFFQRLSHACLCNVTYVTYNILKWEQVVSRLIRIYFFP
jgi:hypothetical protein